jgi:hypothetical protein
MNPYLKPILFESVTTALMYSYELMVELLFIMVLPLTSNELLIVVSLFDFVNPEAYNESLIVVLFNIVDPETFDEYFSQYMYSIYPTYT